MAEKIVGEKYRRLLEIGHGAYGQIDLAEVVQAAGEAEGEQEPQKTYVALKKLYVDVDWAEQSETGVDQTSIREVRILKEVSHPNIVRLIEVFYHHQNLYLAMECMVCDLAKLIDDPKVLMAESDVACIFRQILLAVEHLHRQWVLHRVAAAHPGHQAAKRPGRP